MEEKSTEELAAEMARLRRLEAHYRDFYENAPLAYFLVGADGRVLEANAQAAHLLGYPLEELVGRPVFEFYADSPSGLPRAREVFARFRAGRETGCEELEMRRADGRPLWISLRVRPVLDAEGRVVFARSMAVDISANKLREIRHAVLHRVREEVWNMRHTDDIRQVLVAVKEGMEALRIPFGNCGVNLVDQSGPQPTVRFYSMSLGGEEIPSIGEDPGTEIILRIWRQGRPSYRRDLDAEDPYGESKALDQQFPEHIRSVLDLPFAQGTLALNSTRAEAFSPEDIASLRELAGVLEEGFRRLEDIRTLEQRTRALEEKNRLLAAFHRIGEQILSSLDLDRMLDTLAQQIVRAGIFRSLMVALVDPERRTVEVVRNYISFTGSTADASAIPESTLVPVPDALTPEGRRIGTLQKIIGTTYALDDDNLTSIVARRGEMEVVEGWDERFDHGAGSVETRQGEVAYFIPVKIQERVLAVLVTGSELAEKEAVLHRIEVMQPLLNQSAIALEQARLYREVQQSEERLRQAQKMESLGQLAGGVAHDFNNLLTVITGNAQLLLHELDAKDPQREEVAQIEQAAEQAANLTRQLLAFGRRQILQPRVLDLNQIVAEVSAMLRRLLGEEIELLTVLDPEPGWIEADPGQLEQVLVNLAVNARDAMPQGGRITLETAGIELDQAYARRHGDIPPGAYVRLAVSDTGTGMDAETQSRIFEPFFTTKEAGRGTGLGLSTVYGIVRQSKGYIWVYSEPEKGTTFKIYLPCVEQGGVAPAEEAAAISSARNRETILLVEDQELLRRLGERVLCHSGYTVLAAAAGDEALELVRQHPGPLHLLLTDVVMPGMNGRELAESLKVQRPQLRVLYMSGYTENAIVHRGVLESDAAFLQKPFTLAELSRKVRQVLDAPSS